MPSSRTNPPLQENQLAALSYATPLGAQSVRVYRPVDGSLTIEVGAPPTSAQLLALTPLGILVFFLCCWNGLLLAGRDIGLDLITGKFLILPSLLALTFSALELWQLFRTWPDTVLMSVRGPNLAIPYPTTRSRLEEVPCKLIARIDVVRRRYVLLLIPYWIIEIELDHGPKFGLLRGYPKETLDTVCDLLGPALGLHPKEPAAVIKRASSDAV